MPKPFDDGTCKCIGVPLCGKYKPILYRPVVYPGALYTPNPYAIIPYMPVQYINGYYR